MAEDFEGLGRALVIPQSVINNLNKIDEKINLIASDSEKMATHFTSAMTRMDGSTGDLIKKLQAIQGLVGSVGNLNIKGLGNASTSMSKTATEAERTANNVTKAATAINKMSNTDVSSTLSKMTAELSKLNEDIKLYYGYIGTGKKTYIEFGQQELKTATARAEELMRAISALDEAQKRLNQSGNVFSDYIDDLNGASLSAQRQADEMKKLNQYYKELEQTSAKKAKEDEKAAERAAKAAEKEANAVQRAAEREAKAIASAEEKKRKELQKSYEAQARLDSQLRKSNYQSYVTSTEGSLRTADKANTYAQRAQAIRNLEEAIKKLRTTDANYQKDLQRLSDAHKRLSNEQKKVETNYKSIQTSQRRLMDTSGQLARQLALVFSVSQIEGYIMKLVKVRGEFELQNTALASILQNKDQADRLFAQITELAVKSPFTLKELTTYTKSLSAYSVEYEKLYDTTKMLADVSAGLGVDMQRLILAFGQVKAGYLRGTETRQFNEAGFNILGELAKYYSELEDRIVSVGEVQERQFKRMISFADVEEVFKRVTNAGGMFYNMQEKQAETLVGQMSNLQDSIDLMFNSIGKANDGTLKNMVAFIRSIIENWKEVVYVLEPAVYALGAWKTMTLLASVGNKKFALSLYSIMTNAKTATTSISLMTKATSLLSAAGRGLMSVFAIAIPVALIAGITELYRVATKASREANELKEALDGISKEGFVRASELISNFKVLAERAVEAADGSKEQQAALEELKRTYSDILPEEQLKIESLRELKGEYDSVTTAIYSKIEAQIKEKQLLEVTNNYGAKAADAMDELANRLTDYNISLSTAKTITNEFKSMLEKGLIKDASQAQVELENLIRVFSGQYASLGEKNIWQKLGWTTGVDVVSEIEDAFNAFMRFDNEMKRLEGEPITPFRIGGGTETYEVLKEELDNIVKYKEEWEKQNKDKFSFKVEFNEESKNALIAEYQKFISEIKNKISTGGISGGDVLSANLIIEEAQKAIDKLDVSPQIAQVNDLRVEFSKLYNVDFEKFSFTKMLEGQGFNDFIKRLDEGISSYKEIIKVFDEAAEQGTKVPMMQQWALLQGKTIEEVRQIVPVLEEYRKSLALVTKEENKSEGKNAALQRLKDQISLIKKAGEEYKKLRQYNSKEEATRIVRDSFGDAFKNLGLDIDMTFDTTGIINGLESLYKSVGDKGKKILDESLATIRTQQEIEIKAKGVEKIQEQIDDLFAGYELSVELDKMGLDKNLISRLFDVNTFTLDDVRKNLDKLKAEIGDAGTKYEEVFQKAEEKITEMQEKELEERLKRYASNLEKSVDKINNIKVKAGVDIQYAGSLFSEGKIDANQYANILKEIIAEMNEEIGKINVNKFKESSEYIKAMGDLSLYSKNELAKLAQQIQNLISESSGKMNASDLKVYQDALDKINDRIREIDSPFKNNPISEFKELVRIQKEFNEEKKRYNELLEKRNELEIKLELAKIQLAELKKRQEESPSQDFSSDISNTQNNIKDIISQIGSMNNQLNTSQGIMSNLSSQAGGQLDNQQIAMAKIDKIIKSVYQTINSIVEQFEELKELAETFGAETDEGVWDRLSKSFSAISEMNENVMSSWESYKSGDYVGASVKAVSAIFSVVKGINRIIDSKKEDIIRRQIELVENLQEAYEDLEKAIDKAYSIDTYKKASDQAIENLERQNEALQAAINAERDKKDTDKERIEELEDQMKDNEEAIAQIIEDRISTVTAGILDDGLSAADAFVDAWLEAFQETGDGLQGLEDNFNEMLLNMIKRQAAMSIVAPLIENMQKELEKYINKDDTDLTISEAEKFSEYIKNMLPQYSEALENYVKAMEAAGIEFGDAGDTMSSLQRGIQGITAEQSDALESLLNSVRFFTSDSNTVLHNIYNSIIMPSAENPFLAEMKVQSTYLSSISSLLSSVSKNVQSNGRAIKVQIV